MEGLCFGYQWFTPPSACKGSVSTGTARLESPALKSKNYCGTVVSYAGNPAKNLEWVEGIICSIE